MLIQVQGLFYLEKKLSAALRPCFCAQEVGKKKKEVSLSQKVWVTFLCCSNPISSLSHITNNPKNICICFQVCRSYYKVVFLCCSQVFFLQSEDQTSVLSDPADHSRLTENVARAFCMALCPHLKLLKEDGMAKLGLRVTLDSDQVGLWEGLFYRCRPWCVNRPLHQQRNESF